MTREEKTQIIDGLADQISKYGNFYITDVSNLSVAQVNTVRRRCFEKGIQLQVAKNTLIKRALEKLGEQYNPLHDILTGSSSLMFSESGNLPAKVIKELRRELDKPLVKAAWIEESVYVGDEQLDTLANLKTKNELIADIIVLLQSPAKNVVSGLQSGSQKLAGILKTLESRAN